MLTFVHQEVLDMIEMKINKCIYLNGSVLFMCKYCHTLM